MNAFDSLQKRISLVGVGLLMAASVVTLGISGTSAHEGVAHPVQLHAGGCDAPGDVLLPLSDLSDEILVDGVPSAGEVVGPENATPLMVSVTTIQLPLGDLIAQDHSLVVTESADQPDEVIACGDIGGTLIGTTELPFGLNEVNNSGSTGTAWISDNSDGTSQIRVALLVESASSTDGLDDGHDEDSDHHDAVGGTPESGTPEVTVVIEDFSYGEPIEITAGTTVVWTNADSAPHTVTKVGGGIQSDGINSGDSFTFTFTDPGTYEYFCQFHANMSGTVVVTE